jgi:tRNA(Ile)-lysidine synthase
MSTPQTLQNLPPRWARFCLGVERFLREELHMPPMQEATLLVAISGGADSTALALLLHYLGPRLDCRLQAVHLDHGIRPESGEDARHVGQFCTALDIPCVLERQDVPELARELGQGLEHAGRTARKRFFTRMLEESGAAWIATGHQLNDLAEDQLMRQLRGTGWPALGGMRGQVLEERLLRPLLLTPRATILEFLEALGVPWREDPLNQDPACLRNRVRARIVPAMLDENPDYLSTAASLWRQARLDADYWAEVERECGALPMPQGGVLLPAAMLGRTHQALRQRLYKRCLEVLGPGQVLADNLLRLDRSWREKRVGAKVQFPGGKSATVLARGIAFTAVGEPCCGAPRH